jgi:uncharacterized membrane protein
VDLTWLFPYILFLHVLGAIIAFGPTFAFPIIGAMGGKEPQYANFATRVSATISDRIVVPLGIFQGVTGVVLIWISGRDMFSSAWLVIAIVLYVIALAYALTVQRRHVHRIIELSSAPPPPDAKGPPPGLAEEVKAVQRGGMLLTVLIVVIVFLMVVKPSF